MTATRAPRVIVFDLFGVIARNQTESDKRHIEAIAGLGDPEAIDAFWRAYWKYRPAYDAGQSSHDYWATVSNALGVSYSTETVNTLIEADLASWCDVEPRMVALIEELAGRGTTMGLLSNIITDLLPRFEAKHGGWLRHFESLTYSCRIGVAKPDPRAYRLCAQALGIAPSEALFFDDNERNVAAARETGMSAEVFTSLERVRERLGLA